MPSLCSRRNFLAAAAVSSAACALSVPRSRVHGASSRRPNIVLIMADDMGYSDPGCYGGEIDTPHLDRLAREGMRFTQFYNNAKCAPTRASLLTGLYSQRTGIHDEPARMKHCITIAEGLRQGGYRTAMFGKWHAGELPVQRGFDTYYGLVDGCCNYFNPGNPRPGEPTPVESRYPRKWARDNQVMQPYTPEQVDFYATDAFTNAAIAHIEKNAHAPDPFFLYLAYTAPHYPLHAFPEDIAKYRGRYTVGWDVIREQRHHRMKEVGILPEDCRLSPRDSRIPAWTEVTNPTAWDLTSLGIGRQGGMQLDEIVNRDLWDLKMAVYAAMVDRMDQNIGRLISTLESVGKLDETLVLFLSDNGGCAEVRNLTPSVPPGPIDSYRTVDPPWANVQNTPFRKYKRHDHEGGIATPLIARLPGLIAPGSITAHLGHVIDILPTLLELAEVTYPDTHVATDILPCDGRSLVPVLENKVREVHNAIFWHFKDSCAVRAGRWKLVREGDRPWELYDMENDRTELTDLALIYPDRVKEMSDSWILWAKRCEIIT